MNVKSFIHKNVVVGINAEDKITQELPYLFLFDVPC